MKILPLQREDFAKKCEKMIKLKKILKRAENVCFNYGLFDIMTRIEGLMLLLFYRILQIQLQAVF